MLFGNEVSVLNFTQPPPTHEDIQLYLEGLSQETFMKLIPVVVFFTLLIVVGVSGNILVFIVYFRQFKVSSTRVFVLAMAACDFLTNGFAMPWIIVDVRHSYTSTDYLCRLKALLRSFPIFMSYLILVCVALDRRRRICQPLNRQLTARQASYLLLLLFVLSSVVIIPATCLYGAMPTKTRLSQITGHMCGFSDSKLGMSVKVVFGIVDMTYFAVGFGLLATAYLQIWYQVYRQKKTFPGNTVAVHDKKEPDLQTRSTSREKELLEQARRTENDFISETKPGDSSTVLSSDLDGSTQVEALSLTTDSNECADDRESCLAGHDPQGASHSNKCTSGPGDGAEDGCDTDRRCLLLTDSQPTPDSKVKAYRATPTAARSASTCAAEQSVGVTSGSDGTAPDNLAAGECVVWSTGDGGQGHQRVTVVSGLGAKGNRKQSAVLSRTTLMMFALTVTNIICCVPYIGLLIGKAEYVSIDMSTWRMNMLFLGRCFPAVNSVINPFVYSFCNPKFRFQCRLLLLKVRSRFFS